MKTIKVLLPLILIILVGCKEQELLKGLDQTQSNEILSLLQSNNISAVKREVPKEGFMILVNHADFPTAVNLMSNHDLPSRPRLQIAEMFPSDSLISSPRAEKARLYSGIEQRLEQSLQLLQGVISARVHVSYDVETKERVKQKNPVHLSTLVKYDDRNNDASLIISDIKRFLKNSFTDVDYDNISVVLTRPPQTQHQPPVVMQKETNTALWLLLLLIAGAAVAAGYYIYQKYRAATDKKLQHKVQKDTE